MGTVSRERKDERFEENYSIEERRKSINQRVQIYFLQFGEKCFFFFIYLFWVFQERTFTPFNAREKQCDGEVRGGDGGERRWRN